MKYTKHTKKETNSIMLKLKAAPPPNYFVCFVYFVVNSEKRTRYKTALSEMSLRHQAPSQRMHFTAV